MVIAVIIFNNNTHTHEQNVNKCWISVKSWECSFFQQFWMYELFHNKKLGDTIKMQNKILFSETNLTQRVYELQVENHW